MRYLDPRSGLRYPLIRLIPLVSPARMAAASDRTCEFPLAAQGRVLVPLLVTAFAALDAARHLPIFVLPAMPVIAAALPRCSRQSRPRRERREMQGTHLFAVPATFQLRRSRSDWGCRGEVEGWPTARMPARPSSFLKKRSPSCVPPTIRGTSSFSTTGEAMRSGNSILNIAYLWTGARTSMATICCASRFAP